MIEFLFFQALFPMVSVAFAGYLIYAKYHPKVAQRQCNKYKLSPQAVALYKKMYSGTFLTMALLFGSSSLLDLGLDIYISIKAPLSPRPLRLSCSW